MGARNINVNWSLPFDIGFEISLEKKGLFFTSLVLRTREVKRPFFSRDISKPIVKWQGPINVYYIIITNIFIAHYPESALGALQIHEHENVLQALKQVMKTDTI